MGNQVKRIKVVFIANEPTEDVPQTIVNFFSKIETGASEVHSVQEMVGKIVSLCSQYKALIGKLCIFAHSIPTQVIDTDDRGLASKDARGRPMSHRELGILIGNDIISTASFNEYKPVLARAKKCFDSGSRVFFDVCSLGFNSNLLLRFSDLWGVPVVGYRDLQSPTFSGEGDGPSITCVMGACKRQLPDSWTEEDVRRAAGL